MAVREGFEPSIRLQTVYSLSRGAPSASRPPHRITFQNLGIMARSEGFEPSTAWFVARYSIQLSYERALSYWTLKISTFIRACARMAVREGFEPSIRLQTVYSLSRGAPSASRPPHRLAEAHITIYQKYVKHFLGIICKKWLKRWVFNQSGGKLNFSCYTPFKPLLKRPAFADLFNVSSCLKQNHRCLSRLVYACRFLHGVRILLLAH